MRKLFLTWLSLSVLAFVSCKKDEKPTVTGDMMSFTGTIGGGEKTAIDGVKVKWTENDSILINGKVFHSELEGGGTTAVFTGEALEEAQYEAYYPASLKTDEGYVLPAAQYYNGDNISVVNPMYAESTTTDLQFYNICALMKLVVKGEGKVKTITVSADQPLSGAFTIVKEAAGKNTYCYAKVGDDGVKKVVLNCGDGVQLSETAAKFYVALPQGEYTNLKFTLGDGSGGIYKSASMSRKLTAGKISTKELTNVSVAVPAPLSGVFSVSATQKVRFSCGNLYCIRTFKLGGGYSYAFAFEDEQYDCRSYNGSYKGDGYKDGVLYETPANTSGLFQWNKDDAVSSKSYGAFTEEESISGELDDVIDWGPTISGSWRTLVGGNSGEWKYMFNSRATTYGTGSLSTSNHRYAEVRVNGVRGVLLFPDQFSWPQDAGAEPTVFNNCSGTWNNVNYEGAAFTALENEGVVFLPAAGNRINSASGPGIGYYWSASCSDNDMAYDLLFRAGNVYPMGGGTRNSGFSVRLVCDVK